MLCNVRQHSPELSDGIDERDRFTTPETRSDSQLILCNTRECVAFAGHQCVSLCLGHSPENEGLYLGHHTVLHCILMEPVTFCIHLSGLYTHHLNSQNSRLQWSILHASEGVHV